MIFFESNNYKIDLDDIIRGYEVRPFSFGDVTLVAVMGQYDNGQKEECLSKILDIEIPFTAKNIDSLILQRGKLYKAIRKHVGKDYRMRQVADKPLGSDSFDGVPMMERIVKRHLMEKFKVFEENRRAEAKEIIANWH